MIPEELALCQLAVMVFSDHPSDLDFAYLVTETPNNDQSGITTAARISKENRFLAINGKKPTLIGIGGFVHPACDPPQEIKDKLFRAGARLVDVLEINYSDAPTGPSGLHHTGTEMNMVARFAIEKGTRSIGLIAPPFHQLRSYLHLITALDKRAAGDAIKVFNCPGGHLSWLQEVAHSQGEVRGSRSDLLAREIKNCLLYWEKGHLVSPSLALDYYLSHRF